MRPYEARFLPPDPDYVAPDHSETSEILHGQEHFVNTLRELAEHHTGREGSEALFEAEEERRLFAEIRAGKADGADEDTKAKGEQARQALIETNARLARFFARASLGQQPQAVRQHREGQKSKARQLRAESDLTDQIDDEIPRALKKRSVGTYTNIATLASPHAELEDRMQNALIGLIKAIDNHKTKAEREAENPGTQVREARLSTYAAWTIQGELSRGVSSPEINETLGPRMPVNVNEEYFAKRKLYSVDDLRTVSRDVAGSPGEYERLQHLQEFWIMTEHVPFEEVDFPYAALEEGPEFEGEEPTALRIEEMIANPDITPIDEEVVGTFKRKAIDDALIELSERPAGIIRLRYGLVDGKTKTYDEIGLVYGITRERVRQIERGTMSKLRTDKGDLRSHQSPMLPALEFAESYSGDRIRIARALVRKAAKVEDDTPQERPKAVLPKWCLSIQHIPEDEPPLPGTENYNAISSALIEAFTAAPSQFKIEYEEAKRSPYPRICDEIDRYIGKRLTVQHVQDFWNNYLPIILQTRYHNSWNLDTVGQMVSRLLATRMQPNDGVRLITPHTEGSSCGYLGAWMRQGYLDIYGNVGDFTGLHMGGEAHITVHGDAGYDTGHGAHGSARLTILSSAGKRTGYNMRDQALLVVGQRTQGPVGLGATGDARIIVGGEERRKPKIFAPPSMPATLDSTPPQIEKPPVNVEVVPPVNLDEVQLPTLAEQNDSGAGRMTFEEASKRLGLTPDALQTFTDQLNPHESRQPLTNDDINALKELFPALRIPLKPADFISLADAKGRTGYRGTLVQFAQSLRESGIKVRRFRTSDGKAGLFINRAHL